MNSSTRTRLPSRRSAQIVRRLILTGAMLPVALIHRAHAADLVLGPDATINSDLGAPIFVNGLQEGLIMAFDDETSANPLNGPDRGQGRGVSLGLQMGQSTAFGPDGWGDNRTWVYTGEIFTGPNGILSFAAMNDDNDWIKINNTVVLNDNTWNVVNASVTSGLPVNTWVPFEYRVSNGGGGAGPSGNQNGSVGWSTSLGVVFSWADEAGSLDAGAYDQGKPEEPAGGDQTVFRFQRGFGLPDDLVVQSSAKLTVSGANTIISEQSLRFTNPAAVTLTVDDAAATPHKVLSIAGQTQWATLESGGADVILDGSTDIRPLGAQVDNGNPVIVTRNGTGKLILDTLNAGSNLIATKFAAGTGTIEVTSSTGTSPVPGAVLAITNPAGVLRIGSSTATGATFDNLIRAETSGKLQHTSTTSDTLAGGITILANQTLNFDIAAGKLTTNGGLAANLTNAKIQKTGPGLLRSVGAVNARLLQVDEGRYEVGPITLFTNPILNGGVLVLANKSGSNNLIPNPFVIGGTGALEARGGSFGAATKVVQLTNNGTLRIAGDFGLSGFFYGGDDGGAHNAFGGPDVAANTYTNYTTYFASRGGLEASNLTSFGDVQVLSFDPAGGDTNMFAVYGQNRNNNIVSRMVGKIYIERPGLYTFSTRSDDGSMLYINGNAVVSNNVYQGMTTRSGEVNLAAGYHDIDIGYYEGGGGNGLVASWAGPGINGTQPIPNSVLYPNLNPEQITNAINLAGSATIQVLAVGARVVYNPVPATPTGAFTMQSGVTLTTSGNTLTIDNLVLPTSGGTYTFAANNETVLSQINDAGAPVNIVKTGTGVLTIDNLGAAQLQNAGSTITVNQGSVGLFLGAPTSPTGNATIAFNGGGVVLSSKGGNQSYTIPPLTGSANIEARKLASGVAGTPETPIVISLVGNLNVPAGNTLNLGTRDNYVEEIAGAATGTGTLGITGGVVTAKTATAVQGLRVNFNAANAILNLLSNAPTVGALNNEPGVTGTTLVGDGVGGPAVLQVNGAGTGKYTGPMIAAANNTFSVVKTGPGFQYLGGASQATSYTVNAGTLELSNAALGAPEVPINLVGGVLQFANTGLFLQVFDSDPRQAVGGVPNAYTSILNTYDGVLQRYSVLPAPTISVQTTANNNQFINYNPSGSDTQSPFLIHGHTGLDNIEALFTGFIDIPTAGAWTFDPRSDDGTTIYIDKQLIVNNNFPQGIGHVPRPGTVTLTAGRHEILMTFNEGVGGAGMFVNVTPPGGGSSLLSNSLLFNRNFSAANPLNVTGAGAINTAGGNITLGDANQTSSVVLTVDGGGMISFPRSLASGGSALSYSVGANTIVRPGQLVSIDTVNATGAGVVLLDYDGPQLTTPGATINANGGTVVGAWKPAGNNPLGASTVNLTNGGSLGLTIAAIGADSTFNNPVVIGAGGGGIKTGRFGVGPASAQTITYSAPLAVNNGAPLTFSAADGYTLVLSNTVGSNGPISSTAGTVQTVGTLAGSTLSVTGGTLDTLGPLNVVGATTVSSGGKLRLNGNTFTGGAVNVSGTLEFNGASSGNINPSLDGGKIRVATGIVDLGPEAVPGTAIVRTPTANILAAKSYGFTNPAGGFGTDQGLANTLAATPALAVNLAARDLNFGPLYNADPVFNTFFGGATGDAFTASFTGTFTSPATGPITFGHSILDDNGSIWIDLNQNGTFESFGSAGSERITTGGCCGPDPVDNTVNGVVNLVQGQKYGMVFIIEDTGGGSSFAAKWDVGSKPGNGGLSKFVNPGDPTQAGIWSTEVSTGGGKLEIAADSELRAGSFTNVSDAFLTNNSKLTINATPGAASTFQVLRNDFGTSTVEVTGGNTVTIDHLTVAPSATMRKTGDGTVTTSGLSVGAGGFLIVEGGVLVDTAQAVSGAAGGNSGSVTVTGSGVFELQGTLTGAVQVSAGGTLRGSGKLDALTVDGSGVVAPGGAPGTMGTLSTANFVMLDGTTFRGELFTPLAGDSVNVTGTVQLSQVTLSLGTGAGFSPQPNSTYGLVLNDLDDAVTGTFAGLGEGASLLVGGIPFNITYTANLDGGAVGNDIAVIAVPEPGSAVLLLGGFGMLIGAQRMRRRHRD